MYQFFFRLKRAITLFFYPHWEEKFETSNTGSDEGNVIEDPFEIWPILNFYEKGDPLVDSLPNGASIEEMAERKRFKFTFQFLGIVDKQYGIVFKGDVKEENPSNYPEKVYKKEISKIVNPFVNPAAQIRKRKLEGAKNLCNLENSNYEDIRKIKHQEKMSLDGEDAQPCGVVKDVAEQLKENNIGNEFKKLKSKENSSNNKEKEKKEEKDQVEQEVGVEGEYEENIESKDFQEEPEDIQFDFVDSRNEEEREENSLDDYEYSGIDDEIHSHTAINSEITFKVALEYCEKIKEMRRYKKENKFDYGMENDNIEDFEELVVNSESKIRELLAKYDRNGVVPGGYLIDEAIHEIRHIARSCGFEEREVHKRYLRYQNNYHLRDNEYL